MLEVSLETRLPRELENNMAYQMINIELRKFITDHYIFGFYWWPAHRGTGSKGSGTMKGIYMRVPHKPMFEDSYKLEWSWKSMLQFRAPDSIVPWHRCYRRYR